MLLPKDLSAVHIRKAVEFIETQASDLVDLYFEQANVFSGLVGMFGIRALDSISPYKRHKHPDIAQQRFPDLSHGGRLNPPPELALESKGSTRPWAVQSHYDHSGWYVVWRYLVDRSGTIRSGRAVVIWRVDVVFLTKDDWLPNEGRLEVRGQHGRLVGWRAHAYLRLARASQEVAGCGRLSTCWDCPPRRQASGC